MPWKECSVMDERLRFVAKLLDGESMSGAGETVLRKLDVETETRLSPDSSIFRAMARTL